VRFGEYLISQNVVSEEELVAALDDQARSRPFVGSIAVELGYLTATQSFELSQALVEEGCEFLELARQRGVLDLVRVGIILRTQNERTPKIGQIFVRRKVIGENSLAELLKSFFAQERNRADAEKK